jgi:uncharacterized protein
MKPKYFEVCIIGLGPGGLGAALGLSRSPLAKDTICLEAGVAADTKFCSIIEGKGCRFVQPCQIITGVGGASVLSGGKVSVYPAGRAMAGIIGSESETKKSLSTAFGLFNQFVQLIPPNIPLNIVQAAVEQYAHRGFEFRYYDSYLYHQSDLISGYNRMLDEILASGISVHLETHVKWIKPTEEGFHISGSTGKNNAVEFFSKRLILAVGRYGIDLLNALDPTLKLEGRPNDLDVGVRLEFPTSIWPDINSCHNDLKLHFMNARTFCVCKDGFIAPYRLNDIFLLEGHSEPDIKTGFTNLAITVRCPSDSNLSSRAIFSDIQQRLLKQSNGKPIRQQLTDFLAGRPSQLEKSDKPASISYWQWGSIEACLPKSVYFAVRDAVGYFVDKILPPNALLSVSVFAPEIDYYWSKFPVTNGFLSQKEGVYLIGDCAGHFRGILQAFCSGIECVEHILGVCHVQ